MGKGFPAVSAGNAGRDGLPGPRTSPAVRKITCRRGENGRSEQEIDDALAEDPSADLVPPTGVFLLARDRQGVAGAVGLRRPAPRITELTRLFVHPRRRRGGGGARLLAAAERAARELGATTMRLETRSDLVEARNLYARQGYTEIPPYNNAPYAEHWFEKHLG
ncbi:GNAT family N-acetyltransferase [Streptomyces sp. 8N616]|uniref:GNAT family N-acetyltransferase n=1 Tax=Streptomyces sp. 8N616 TaxID=3457414 RepID=UPI003FCEFDF2